MNFIKLQSLCATLRATPITCKICYCVSVIINLILAAVLAYATWNTDQTTTKQLELFDAIKTDHDKKKVALAREGFTAALDKAEKYCSSCSSCTPTYLIGIPLDKALLIEPAAATRLTAAEYNRLAVMGSYLWDFQKTEKIANKALKKSQTSLDRYVSEMVLGHIHFRHSNDCPEHANINDARKHFLKALFHLRPAATSKAGKHYRGFMYSLWAKHEAFQGNDSNCQKKKDKAQKLWSKLSNHEVLIKKMNDEIQSAKDGCRPEISCFFMTPSATPKSTCGPRSEPKIEPIAAPKELALPLQARLKSDERKAAEAPKQKRRMPPVPTKAPPKDRTAPLPRAPKADSSAVLVEEKGASLILADWASNGGVLGCRQAPLQKS